MTPEETAQIVAEVEDTRLAVETARQKLWALSESELLGRKGHLKTRAWSVLLDDAENYLNRRRISFLHDEELRAERARLGPAGVVDRTLQPENES